MKKAQILYEFNYYAGEYNRLFLMLLVLKGNEICLKTVLV